MSPSLTLASVATTFDAMFGSVETAHDSYLRSPEEVQGERVDFDRRSLALMEDERKRFDYVIDPALNDHDFHGLIDRMAAMSPHISGGKAPTDAQLLDVAKQMFEQLSRNAFKHCIGEEG